MTRNNEVVRNAASAGFAPTSIDSPSELLGRARREFARLFADLAADPEPAPVAVPVASRNRNVRRIR